MHEWNSESLRQTIIRVLRKLAIFAGLEQAEYELLVKACYVESLGQGHFLFKQGESGHELYILLHGRMRVQSSHSGVIGVLGPGEIVGEMAVVRRAPRSASVIAESDALLFRIRQSDLDLILGKAPRISYLLMRNIAAVLAERLADSNRL